MQSWKLERCVDCIHTTKPKCATRRRSLTTEERQKEENKSNGNIFTNGE
jgi:hypothetical protein